MMQMQQKKKNGSKENEKKRTAKDADASPRLLLYSPTYLPICLYRSFNQAASKGYFFLSVRELIQDVLW